LRINYIVLRTSCISIGLDASWPIVVDDNTRQICTAVPETNALSLFLLGIVVVVATASVELIA
jgi:hypothetical protein